jgi:deazaflavin-dependent oxidoreductase (nitroreductase family)
VSDWNAGIIDEFRANDGRVGGMFEGAPLLLLHHVGARTGTERVSPLMYQATNGDYAVFASKAGADTNPDWFYNLMANPQTKVEVGIDTTTVRARLAEGDEHDRIWEQQKQN